VSRSNNPRRHPDTAFRPIGDEGGLVVLPGSAEVKVLNPVGIKIYSLLDGEHSVDSIAAAVVAEFDVDEAAARRDLEGFLQELDANGMLVDAESAESVPEGRRE
jgi:hypothetical protein